MTAAGAEVTRRRGLRVLLLAAFAALAALLLPAAPASAASSPAAEKGVGAISTESILTVGVHESIRAGQHPVRGPSQLQLVSGHCVAADSEYVDLYHGTTRTGAAGIRVNGIDLSLANPRTDFGPGFYTTRSLEQAAARAEAVGGPEGEILHYRVPTAAFDNLSGLTFESGGDAYASFLRGIREGDMHGFDYVEGPFLRNPGDFYAGKDAITTGNQVSFHTPSAVELLNGYLLP